MCTRKRSALAVLLTAGLLALVGASDAAGSRTLPAPDVVKQRVEALVNRLAKEQGFSGVVRLDLQGKPLVSMAVGYADPVAKRPFKLDTQVLVGSITKTFTGTALLKLMDEGKLSIEDPLSKFFPGLPADKAPITLRQLLTHSSGLPDPKGEDSDAVTREQFEKSTFAAPLRFAPGSRYEYSNAGYSVLADVVERVSGMPYETFLREKVLLPAGIKFTGMKTVYDPNGGERTQKGVGIRESTWGANGPHWNLLGNGGIVSTADDMVKYRESLAAGKILKLATVELAQKPWLLEERGSDFSQGLGWGVVNHDLFGKVVTHNGGNPFFSSDLRHLIDHDLILFVAANVGPRQDDDPVGPTEGVPATRMAIALTRAAFGLGADD